MIFLARRNTQRLFAHNFCNMPHVTCAISVFWRMWSKRPASCFFRKNFFARPFGILDFLVLELNFSHNFRKVIYWHKHKFLVYLKWSFCWKKEKYFSVIFAKKPQIQSCITEFLKKNLNPLRHPNFIKLEA